MQHKTLKEAYESVGEYIHRGDMIRLYRLDPEKKVLDVNGGFYLLSGESIIREYANPHNDLNLTITRDGKQIYPKVEQTLLVTSEMLYTELLATLRDNELPFYCGLAQLIDRFIDAKIKEAK